MASTLLLASLVTSLASGRTASASVVYTGAGPSAWNIGVIGDSAWAGIRWIGSWGPLQQHNYRADLESCRRTLAPSCNGREGYPPPTTVQSMKNQSGSWGAVLVIATGYNDPGSLFASGVDAVMAEAISQHIYRVVWMTMRTANVTYSAPTYSSNNVTFRHNNEILRQKAQQYGGRLVVADWDAYTAYRPDWFTTDGIHLRPAGGYAAAQFIADSASRALASVGQPPSTPQTWVDVSPGDVGTRVLIVQRYLERAGISVFGGHDSVYGGHTTAAVMEFQRQVGLPVTGVVDKATAVELGLWYRDDSTPRPTPPSGWLNVVAGDRGMRVAIVQSYLRSRGVAVNGDSDGVFRWATLIAVRTFQASRGLAPTGIVDKSTAIALGLWPADGSPPAPPAPTNGWHDVAPGDVGIRVAIVHSYLRQHGVSVLGDYDGVYRDATTDAVRLFQGRRRLPISGVVDIVTAIELGLWPRPTLSATSLAAASLAVAETAPADTTTSEVPEEPASTEAIVPTTDGQPEWGALGDFVWLDANADGIQQSTELGVAGVSMRLLALDGAPLAATTTDAEGRYEFVDLEVGAYLLEMVVPAEFDLTIADAGMDEGHDAFDSDASPAELVIVDSVRIARLDVVVQSEAADADHDIGLVPVEAAPGPTVPPTTGPPTTTTTTTSTTSTTSPSPPTTAAPTSVAISEPPTSTSQPPTTVVGTTVV